MVCCPALLPYTPDLPVATGAAVPNAKVEAENIATGVKATTTTNENGFYRFNNLLVGTYKVTGSAAGLTPAVREADVELNKTATANITLSVGTLTQQVQVTASSALIDTTTAQVTNIYTKRMLSDLPLAANPVNGGGGSKRW